MAYKRKGGSALMALAKRRKLKAAKDKEGKLSPVVIKPALSKLRTGAAPKRKKGGKAMMDLAKRRRPAAKKKPVSSAVNRANRLIAGDNPVRKAKPKAAPKPKAKAKTSAYSKLLKADRTKKFAPGAGGARGGGTISKTDPRQSAAHGPGAMSGAIKRARKSSLGKLLDLPIDSGLAGAGGGGKSAIKLGQRLNKTRKLRNAGRKGGQSTARKRQTAAGKKTEEGYAQFEKDRKARSRKMGQRN